MKKTVFALLAVFVILGCGESTVSSRLDILERFVMMNPDSVYKMLVELENEQDQFAQEDKMHYIILRAQCQNHLDLPFDSLGLLREAADYFYVNGNPNEKLLSRYLLARAYHVEGDIPMALEYYFDCLTEVDTTYKNLDYVQLSKVHSQLADVYHEQKLSQYELNELRQAEKCAFQGNDSSLAALYHELMAKPYDLEGCYDSVLIVSQEAAHMYEAIGMKTASARALEESVFPYIQQKKYTEAKRCMDFYEKESGDVDENGNVLTDAKIYYHKKGLYYLGINKTDSADYFFHKLIAENSDLNDREAAYRDLLALYRTVGNKDSIGKYSFLYCEANDSSYKQTIAEDVLRMKSIYDYTRYKTAAAQKEMQTQDFRRKVIYAVFILIIISVCVVFYIIQSNRQRKVEIGCLLAEYNRVKSLIEQIDEDKETLLEKHRRELSEIQESLKQKVTEYNKDAYDGLDVNVIGKFKYVSGLSPTNHSVSINAEDWQLLRKEMMTHEENFLMFLSRMALSDGEKNVAMLIRLKFSDYEIKRIMDIYGSSLTNYKTKINKKLFNSEGCRTLRHQIYMWKD